MEFLVVKGLTPIDLLLSTQCQFMSVKNPPAGSRPIDTLPSYGATDTGPRTRAKERLKLALILKKKPKLRHLTEVLTPIKHKYETIGVQLEVDVGVIQSIKARSNDDYDVKLMNVLTKWMDNGDPPVIWETIVDIVGRNPIKNNSLKEDILKFLTNLSDEELEEGPQPTPTTLITQRPHLPSSSSSQYSTRSQVQNREPRNQVSSSASTSAVPFIIMPKSGNVRKCHGCGSRIFKYVKLVVKHQDVRKYTRNRRGKACLCSRHGNVYYHLQMSCIEERHGRSIPPSSFMVSEDAKSIIPMLTPHEYMEFSKFDVTTYT